MARSFVVRCAARAPLVVLLAAALAATPASAQWKWKDKSGHVQYSDLPPPPGTPDQDILGRPSAGRGAAQAQAQAQAAAASQASAPALTAKTTDSELEAKRKKAEADAAAKQKADEARVAAAKADNCARARNQMKSLESGIRLARTNDKGEREVLDDKMRAEETKRTQDVISVDCK